MPRICILTITSPDIQGDGSWIKIRPLTHAQARELENLKFAYAKDPVGFDLSAVRQQGDDLLVDHLVEWNWTDEDGAPLPLPKDDPTVIERMLERELDFIGTEIGKTASAPKKS